MAIFGDDVALASDLFSADTEFAEICDDFLSLVTITAPDARTAEHIADSLSGLEEELRRYLKKIKAKTAGLDTTTNIKRPMEMK